MICESLRGINMLILCMGIVLVGCEFGLLMWTYYNARPVSLVWTFRTDRLLLLCTAWSLFLCSVLQVTNSSLFPFAQCLQVTDRSLASLLMRSWQFYLRRKIRSGSFLNRNAYLWRNWQATLSYLLDPTQINSRSRTYYLLSSLQGSIQEMTYSILHE